MRKTLIAVFTAIVLFTSCNLLQRNDAPVAVEPQMLNSADSMSYVMGLNLGLNLIAADSMLNAEMVCMGIRDVYAQKHKLSDEEARNAFLKYMNWDNYERVKAFETQFLADLRKADRKFVATTSGLTYKVRELGDMKSVARSTRDTIVVCYRVLNSAGEVVDTTYYHGDTLRLALGDMTRGAQEATRLIGKGGHIEAWLPSTLAFGSAGCDSLDVKPNTMLYYEIRLLEVVPRTYRRY